ncbi:hypothetical protein D9V32_11770 [Mycetocola tolaasinivorans]|uniref:MacB-like periplasmic core domain-containing protein n=1 Tax=Mycetocola tolaasinivorans TaxID=76635 RepID=A0A3L7A4D0_9MICO|nr:ABC transporter permease [Mycetocola tolaasinivorans]RLP74710.1 hypothetical protein D9V32_11770 [Mycetocola tolaasinivorans]
MREILYDIRRNGALILLRILIVALALVSTVTTVSFTESTTGTLDSQFSARAENNLAQLIDTYYDDPDAFLAIRNNPEAMAQVSGFYDALTRSTALTPLSMFDQAVPVQEFRGDDRFDHTFGTDLDVVGRYADAVTGTTLMNVKSMQMSRQAFEFYGLTASAGEAISWAEVDYASGMVPVLLGSDYQGVYAVGDTLRGDLYGNVLDLTVSGFLPPESAVYYRGEINTFLRDRIVMPYPETLVQPGEDTAAVELTPKYQSFLGILTFAMINTDLAFPLETTTDELLAELTRIGQQTGFTQHALIGVPLYLTQFALVRQIVVDNLALVSAVQVLMLIAALVAAVFISYHVHRRRLPRVRILEVLGAPTRALIRERQCASAAEYTLTLALFGLGVSLSPALGIRAALIGIGALIVWFLLDIGVQRWFLLRALDLGPRSATDTPQRGSA